MKRIVGVAVAIVALLAPLGCSVGSSTKNQVRITDSGFSPAQVSTKLGGAVTWVNDSTSAHTVTFADSDSGTISPGKTYSQEFGKGGTYDYFCRYHVSKKGKVEVR